MKFITKLLSSLLSFFVLIVPFFSFGADLKSNKENVPLKIISTIGMIGDIVTFLVRDLSDSQSLIGAGIDPHLYQPTRGDIVKLQGADIIFYNGLFLEGKMSQVFNRLAKSGKEVIGVGDKIPKELLLSSPDFPGAFDPHIWMDPKLWLKVTEQIATTLKSKISSSKLEENLIILRGELKQLDNCIAAGVASIPEERRVLVTAHDAFGYFGRRYKIEVLGIQGLSTESEAGLKHLERLVALVVERKIPAVFVESTLSDRNIRALIDGSKSAGHEVKIGGTLYSDAMGQAGTYVGTYIGMIDHNATTIVRALSGDMKPEGCFSKLQSS
jgi:manganese/zinc/iron transport system substrate-binding protein